MSFFTLPYNSFGVLLFQLLLTDILAPTSGTKTPQNESMESEGLVWFISDHATRPGESLGPGYGLCRESHKGKKVHKILSPNWVHSAVTERLWNGQI